ncbi:hypothetical protein RCL1_008091 [Eukaryota sp. TZLM3-RCL]
MSQLENADVTIKQSLNLPGLLKDSCFDSKNSLRLRLVHDSLLERRELRFVHSDQTRLRVSCCDQRCSKLCACRNAESSWTITDLIGHSCTKLQRLNNKMANTDFIAEHQCFVNKILSGDSYNTKDLYADFKCVYGVEIESYVIKKECKQGEKTVY